MSSSTLTTTKTTELQLQLASLGLNNIADNLDDFLARATKQLLSPRQLLEQLARIEVFLDEATGEENSSKTQSTEKRC